MSKEHLTTMLAVQEHNHHQWIDIVPVNFWTNRICSIEINGDYERMLEVANEMVRCWNEQERSE